MVTVDEAISSKFPLCSLTNLPTRYALLDLIDDLTKKSAYPLLDGAYFFNALIILDIKRFRKINDSKGHKFGDSVLCLISERIKKVLPEKSLFYRVGGNEFAILIFGISKLKDNAKSFSFGLSKTLLQAVTSPYHLTEQFTHIDSLNCCCGIVLFQKHCGVDSQIYGQAEAAVRKAKHSHEVNKVILLDDIECNYHFQSSIIENQLHNAIKLNEFELYYQAQNNHLGEIIGAESLIRWRHPTYGLIPPQSFISIAEDTGLIIPIGEWVIKSVCEQLMRWQDNDHTKKLTLAANVSVKQLYQESFISYLSEVVEKTGIAPSRLKIEITESMSFGNSWELIEKVREIKEIGISISIDDFGSGYSSLSYIDQFAPNQIKIDQSFLKKSNLSNDKEDTVNQSLIKAIIQIGKTLNVEVLAEGVETPDQFDFLIENGCQMFQGYLFSKPIPINEFNQLLLKNQTKKFVN